MDSMTWNKLFKEFATYSFVYLTQVKLLNYSVWRPRNLIFLEVYVLHNM